METNGVANIIMILESVDHGLLDKDKALDRIREQAVLLERYMLEYAKNPDIKWHEVRDNARNFPTLKERSKK